LIPHSGDEPQGKLPRLGSKESESVQVRTKTRDNRIKDILYSESAHLRASPSGVAQDTSAPPAVDVLLALAVVDVVLALTVIDMLLVVATVGATGALAVIGLVGAFSNFGKALAGLSLMLAVIRDDAYSPLVLKKSIEI
jgi:hypothetical protein